MKYIVLLSSFIIIGCQTKNKKDTIIDLPLTFVEGYGPFLPSFSLLINERKNDPVYGKMYMPIKGIPLNWSNVNKAMIWLNGYQLMYQNYLARNISANAYKSFHTQWLFDERKLSKKAIKCFVYVIWGINNKGNCVVMVDTNNNLDFSDEKEFHPEILDSEQKMLSVKNTQIVNYELYQNGQINEATIPLIIKQFDGRKIGYNFPVYAKTVLIQENQRYELAVAANGFTSAVFQYPELMNITNWKVGDKIEEKDIIGLNNYITLGGIMGDKYKNCGVDLSKNCLKLEGIAPDSIIFPMQTGFTFKPFTAIEFSTQKTISLKDFQGKYVFIDFWGTWCRGCVQDMPNLIKLYNQIDTSKIAMVGIVSDKPESLKKFISKNDIKWPQLLSDKTNKLIEKYEITGFPTSVLISPDGEIIAKNLRSQALDLKIQEFNLRKAQ